MQGISERVPKGTRSGTRSWNRGTQQERVPDFLKRNATGTQSQQSRGTRKERMRSSSVPFFYIFFSKAKEKRRKIAIFNSFEYFQFSRKKKIFCWNENGNYGTENFCQSPFDIWYFGTSKIRKGTQKERKKERAFLIWKRNGAGTRSRFPEKERGRNAFLKIEERLMPCIYRFSNFRETFLIHNLLP